MTSKPTSRKSRNLLNTGLDNTHITFNSELPVPNPLNETSGQGLFWKNKAKRIRAITTSSAMEYIMLRSNKGNTKPISSLRFFSLYKLLLLELNLPGLSSIKTATPGDDEERRQAYEQLQSMAQVPFYLEKFIAFGLLVCLNLFLTLITLVPLKVSIVIFKAMWDFVASPSHDLTVFARKVHFVKRDFFTLVLIVSTVALLATPVLEVSRLYHDIRGQAHIKLYVIFGVLEVADKLLSSVSQEAFAVLVGIRLSDTRLNNFGMLALFSVLALVLSTCHSYVLIYQSVSLHVAANSYSNALLTLLLSNQFAELKSAVFKKFDREGLFQVTLSDLTERFQLSIILAIIAFRNISQLNSTQLGLTPDSWKSWNKWIGAIFGPSVVVLGSEIFVDWIKHCFINKFNRIGPKVYDNFLYVLSLDFIEVFGRRPVAVTHETSDYVRITRRIGIPIMSLSVCLFRMILSDLKDIYIPKTWSTWNTSASLLLFMFTFVALVMIKLLLGLWLLQWARHIKEAHELRQKNQNKQAENMKKFTKEPKAQRNANFASVSLLGTTGLAEAKFSSEITTALKTEPKSSSVSILPVLEPAYFSGLNAEEASSPADSEIEASLLPGVSNTESSSANHTNRSYLYDRGEKVPPTMEEKRIAQFQKKLDSAESPESSTLEPLRAVHRYEMSSKRIW